MTLIFWGAFFAVLNFNLHLGAGVIGILPDTIGYLLLVLGMNQLEKSKGYLDEWFKRGKMVALLLAVMGVWDYLQSLMGWQVGGLEIMILWGTAEVFLVFSCWQDIIFGIAEIQKRENVELKCKALLKVMSGMVLIRALCLVLLTFGGMMYTISQVVGIFVGLMFVIQVFYTKRRYDLYRKGLHSS